jgi:hypothetical protein
MTTTNWRWLEDTYWCVPPQSLPALRFDQDDNTLTWRVDQTVWHITSYHEGYFWGVTAALFRDAGEDVPKRGPGSQPTGATMLGSITPEGNVHLTFIQTSRGTSTIGLGRIVPHEGGQAFQMQMSTGAAGQTTLHWAYMVQVRPGDPYWDSLPGFEGLSMTEMLEGLEAPVVEGAEE